MRILILLFLLMTSGYNNCFAQIIIKGYSNSDICEAIRKTENSKSHPYGIMVKYKHTTPKQACMNTIRHARQRWNGEGDFIEFLGRTYSPPSINPNWVRLVHYFLTNQGASK